MQQVLSGFFRKFYRSGIRYGAGGSTDEIKRSNAVACRSREVQPDKSVFAKCFLSDVPTGHDMENLSQIYEA